MKSFRQLSVLLSATICSAILLSSAGTPNAATLQEGPGSKHGFSVKQYDEFHDVLHPLQHEALPNKDFKMIMAQSALLTRHGRAIVKLGVPHGTSKENRSEFVSELNKFSKALARYRSDAKHVLEASYNAVHDSFEMLVAMLPRS